MFKLTYVELVTGIKAAQLKELINQGVLSAEDRDGIAYISAADIVSYLKSEGRFVPDVFKTDTIRILVVDDEKNMLNALKRLFQRFSRISVSTAANAFEMGHSLETVIPDIIILDYMMPGMDGLAILNNLREHGYLEKVFVLVYTAQPPDKIEQVFSGYKNIKVLAKSADFRELLLTVEQMLRRTN